MAHAFPIADVRAQFPALSLNDREHNAQARIYLDNPAGTQIPQMVIDAVSHTWIHHNANLGGAFQSSHEAQKIVDDAHHAMADFFGTEDRDEIIIGSSMTSQTFHLSRSIAHDFAPSDEIIVTNLDHEGNVAPWLHAAQDKGCRIKYLPFNQDSWCLEADDLEPLLTENTRLLALNGASNLLGSISDIKRLTQLAHQAGAWVYLDGVQYAPHRLFDVTALGVDFAACSAYKFFGPHLGVLWGKKALLENLPAYRCRTAPSQPSGKFETGTPQIELLAGLTATINYWADLGIRCGSKSENQTRRKLLEHAYQAQETYETSLLTQLISGLMGIKGINIHGITDSARFGERVPTIALTHQNCSPSMMAEQLARDNIFVWNGHNYALGVVRQLGLEDGGGVLRIGPVAYNTAQEIDTLLSKLAHITKSPS